MEVLIFSRWNQEISGKAISLSFFSGAPNLSTSFSFCLDKDILLLMQKNMARFVEKREPEMVIALATEAQID